MKGSWSGSGRCFSVAGSYGSREGMEETGWETGPSDEKPHVLCKIFQISHVGRGKLLKDVREGEGKICILKFSLW